MAGNTSRIMIKTYVKSALKDADSSPERCTRKLVDMALHFSKGRFQQHFFEMAQTMLSNEESPYYPLIEDVLKHMDKDRLIGFGMNIGYNGCTMGAHIIRKLKRTEGREVQWYVPLKIDDLNASEILKQYQDRLRSNKEQGVYVYCIYMNQNPAEIFPLIQKNPDCAFILLCRAEDINEEFAEKADSFNNLLIGVDCAANTKMACRILRDHRLLYSIYRNFTDEDLRDVYEGNFFRYAAELHSPFAAVLYCNGTEKEREKIHKTVLTARNTQQHRTIPVDLLSDANLIGTIISQSVSSPAPQQP